MRINVTREHIAGGDFNNSRLCPIRYAIKDAIGPGHDIRVWYDYVVIDDERYDLPREAGWFQRNGNDYEAQTEARLAETLKSWEASDAPEPFDFELDYHPEDICEFA